MKGVHQKGHALREIPGGRQGNRPPQGLICFCSGVRACVCVCFCICSGVRFCIYSGVRSAINSGIRFRVRSLQKALCQKFQTLHIPVGYHLFQSLLPVCPQPVLILFSSLRKKPRRVLEAPQRHLQHRLKILLRLRVEKAGVVSVEVKPPVIKAVPVIHAASMGLYDQDPRRGILHAFLKKFREDQLRPHCPFQGHFKLLRHLDQDFPQAGFLPVVQTQGQLPDGVAAREKTRSQIYKTAMQAERMKAAAVIKGIGADFPKGRRQADGCKSRACKRRRELCIFPRQS